MNGVRPLKILNLLDEPDVDEPKNKIMETTEIEMGDVKNDQIENTIETLNTTNDLFIDYPDSKLSKNTEGPDEIIS